ncbi:MotA/TolQ/ExbB proton channel family protein, partial [Campylobacter coli]
FLIAFWAIIFLILNLSSKAISQILLAAFLKSSSLSLLSAKIVHEALVATGCGILVAIPAYTFHLIIKRKAFELLSIIDSEIKVIS